MPNNKDLTTAKREKKDEFYTQLTDIEKELKYYNSQFKDKVVYCNCDDPFESNFFKFFALKFNSLGLKKLIATCYMGSSISNTELILFDNESAENKTTKVPHKIVINELTDENNDGGMDLRDIVISLAKNQNNTLTRLQGDGDFRSAECIELLKEADIVCTNPPFSLFREYVAQLVEYDKQFLIIGNVNAVSYKETFKLIKENKLRLGRSIKSGDREFRVPEHYPLEAAGCRVADDGNKYLRIKGVRWFTNLDLSKYYEDIILWNNYNPEEHKKYDNYDAINIDKTNEIPKDYAGEIGVPITFLDKWNPNQFEIIGLDNNNDETKYKWGANTINGKTIYRRIIIKPKDLRYDMK